MSHRCPATACTVYMDDSKLMRRPHWYMVPKALRDAVWSEYADGAGLGSTELAIAQSDAIGAVNAKIEQREML